MSSLPVRLTIYILYACVLSWKDNSQITYNYLNTIPLLLHIYTQEGIYQLFILYFRLVCDAAPNDLLPYKKEENTTPCDICTDGQLADVYCGVCNKKLCTEHEQVCRFT